MAELKLSDDGLYYWDGSRWISTLSPDGRWRWNGTAWVPLTGMVAPAYQPYQAYPQPAAPRVPSRWTRPMQYAVAAWYALSGLYALSLPFWMSGLMSQIVNRSIQQSAAQNPDVSPPPADVVSSLSSIFTATLWVAALIGAAIAAVIIIGALKRWTWIFYVVLVLLGLGAISLPFNLISAIAGTATLSLYSLPSWVSWLSVVVSIPGAALFVWMLVAAIRFGPWAMPRRVDSPATS